MARFLSLTLPLLCLGIFWWSGANQTTSPSADSGTRVSTRAERTPPSQQERTIQKRAPQRFSTDRRFADSLQPLTADFFPRDLQGILPGVPLSQNAQAIWRKIPSKSLAPLSARQINTLATFLNTRLAEEARGERRWICWDDKTSPAMAMAHHEIERAVARNSNSVGILATQFLGSGKWSTVASGSPSASTQGNSVTVTWSIVPDGTSAPGLGFSSAPSDFRSWMSGLYGGSATGTPSEQPWFALLNSTFEAVEENSGLKFVYEPNDDGASIATRNRGRLGTRGDIRVSARLLDGDGDPKEFTNTLAFAYAPNFGDIILDSGDSFFNNKNQNSVGFFNTFAHELGHAVGLDHVCPISATKLMEPFITRAFRGPQYDEFYSLQRQYGDELESAHGEINNDSFSKATPLTLDENGYLEREWLSIDDNSDIDYFSFSAKQFDQLQVAVNPGNLNYQEGPETDSCNTGPDFLASSQQNLIIDLLDTDGSTILETANSAAIGEIESLTDYAFQADGTYYLRINGGSTNTSQLYTLFLDVSGAPPLPIINLLSQEILAESGVVKNSHLDDRETVKILLKLENTGAIATENLIATFSAPSGVTFFTPEITFPTIPVDGSGNAEFIFAVEGSCGQEIPITINLTDGEFYTKKLTLSYPVGETTSTTPLPEEFETTALPPGWATSTDGEGIAWLTNSSESHTGNRSVYAQNVSDISSSTLTSPPFTLGNISSTLRFFHHYDHEERWDGGVLVASLDGGAWFDLPTHSEVTVISGGYPNTIRDSAKHDLAGRSAWTGNSANFIESAFKISSSWAGQQIRFRWILAHDDTVSEKGWFIDDVTFTTESGSCEPHHPVLQLTATNTTLSEGDSSSTSTLQLTSALPLLDPITVTLALTGNGDAADLSGLTPLTLPAGQTEISITLSAVADSTTEGEESLTLTLPENEESFAAGTPSSVTLTINDQAGFASWASAFFETPPLPEADSDADGWSNLSEYLLNTDPSDPNATPDLRLLLSPEMILLPLGNLPDRSDATLGVEQSADLKTWSPASVTKTSKGLTLPRDPAKKFLRLTFSINP